MKPNYKNWIPKGRVVRYLIETAACLIAAIVFGAVGFTYSLTWAIALFAVSGAAAFVLALVSAFLLNWHNVFSYDGKRQLSKIIIEGVAKYVKIPDGGKCLDVGCGTGALPVFPRNDPLRTENDTFFGSRTEKSPQYLQITK